ncbi:MAG: hypothetical protein COB98_01010 [Flavobacteriaceae bacterium]|nr:MAG: hypothetical protein COB98_01010 [Flavobacteriaceae bacterium]
MKTASVKEIKTALKEVPNSELIQLCLELSKFKKENKELLTYLLFESTSEASFIADIKTETIAQFACINTSSYFYIKKSVRKILRRIKTYIRYSKNKETEIELLLFFCQQMNSFKPSIKGSDALYNIYKRETINIRKKLLKLHEDLQFDYLQELERLG